MINTSPRIAIIRLTALGDIVNTSIILQIIKMHYPHAKIEWICEEVFAPLLKFHPLLEAVHTVNIKKLKKQFSLGSLFQQISLLKNLGHFDLIIDMQGLLKSAIVAKLLKGTVHGYDKDSAREGVASYLYNTTSHIAYDENIIRRNVMLCCDALEIPFSETMISNKNRCLPSHALKSCFSDSEYIVFVIGASWESKMYPAEKFAQLANTLEKTCYLVWGDTQELELAQAIQKTSHYVKVSEKLSLLELIALIENAQLVIGNDTGPTHMAWAQNIPSITLFGPTTSRMMYETAINIALKSPSTVNINKINKQDFSIREINVNSIATAAKKLLKVSS